MAATDTDRPDVNPPESTRDENWHESLARAIRNPAVLLNRLGLQTDLLPAARQAAEGFPLLAPLSYVDRMQHGRLDDPLLRQVLPISMEQLDVPGFTDDAVDDARFRIAPGLLHKYQGRALLITTGSCAVHCRYCFRRHYPYSAEPRRIDDWEPALQALHGDNTITEVLLSGGDPLMLTDERLATLLQRLRAVPHLQRIRLHTRLPIVLPNRITDELLALLDDLGTDRGVKSVVVVHANHAAELVDDCAHSLRRLVASGVMVLNQAVLLRGVNDSADSQCELSTRLIQLGVMPYYLHQLDRVRGAAHFEVPIKQGIGIVDEMRRRLPGYAVPRYVQEIAGESFKTVIA